MKTYKHLALQSTFRAHFQRLTWVFLILTVLSAMPPTVRAQQLAYIADDGFRADSVSVVDLASNQLKLVIKLVAGSSPQEVVLTPDGGKLYVTNSGGSTVAVVETATQNISYISLPSPHGIAITPDGKSVYVTLPFNNEVAVIDTASDQIKPNGIVSLPSNPWEVAVTPDGSTAYVTHIGGTNIVSVIKTATNAVLSPIALGSGPFAIGISPNGASAYAPLANSTVSVINTAANTVTPGSIQLPFDDVRAVSFSPDGALAYLLHFRTSGPGFESAVSVIDTVKQTLLRTFFAGNAAEGMAFSADGTQLYLTSNNGFGTPGSLLVLDAASGNVTNAVSLGGSGAGGLAITSPQCSVSVQRLGQCRIFDPLPYLPTLNPGDFAPWNAAAYAFHSPSEGFDGSICDKGCALTALSMALLDSAPLLPDCPRLATGLCIGLPLTQPNNPGTLNAFMNRGILLFDYDAGNNVDWDVATRDVGIHVASAGQTPKLRFDLTCNGLRSGQAARPGCGTATEFLDHQLCGRRPVIVRVTGSDGVFGDHKVLVVGKSASDYLINDPANLSGSPIPHHDRLSQYGLFDIVGVVIDPVGDMSGLNMAVGTNADLLVTDSAGRRTGADPNAGEDLQEIAQSAHLVDATDDEVTGAPPTSSIHLVNVFQPAEGAYQIAVTGLQRGPYTISINGYFQDGSAQVPVMFTGVTDVGLSDNFAVSYSPVPGQSTTVKKMVTIEVLRRELQLLFSLGDLGDQKLFDTLDRRLAQGQKALAENEVHEAIEKLEQFLKKLQKAGSETGGMQKKEEKRDHYNKRHEMDFVAPETLSLLTADTQTLIESLENLNRPEEAR